MVGEEEGGAVVEGAVVAGSPAPCVAGAGVVAAPVVPTAGVVVTAGAGKRGCMQQELESAYSPVVGA